jgi:hypothetical protein
MLVHLTSKPDRLKRLNGLGNKFRKHFRRLVVVDYLLALNYVTKIVHCVSLAI